jgi:hypothetical protein
MSGSWLRPGAALSALSLFIGCGLIAGPDRTLIPGETTSDGGSDGGINNSGGAGGAGGMGTGGIGGAGVGGSALLPNGSPCTFAGECGSANCVDMFCCDTACNGTCEACDVAGSEGTCGSALDGTPCVDGTLCNGDETCVAGVCTSAGDPCSANIGDGDADCSEACNEAQVAACTAPEPAMTPCLNGVCDGAGSCVLNAQ